MEETQLAGGRTTSGVVRIGDTVRRPAQPNSEFVRALLSHLEKRGFSGAPRFLGVDDSGRECFAYIDGDVPADLSWHDDATIVAAARLIRAYHDATADFVGSLPAPTRAEVACHNDLSPCNTVFVDGAPAALIDFDAAAPGSRIWDIAYAAWLWLDVGNDEISRQEQVRRLALFADAYDPNVNLRELVRTMLQRQRNLAAQKGDPDRSAWALNCAAWVAENFDGL